jgi:hypothetical protein
MAGAPLGAPRLQRSWCPSAGCGSVTAVRWGRLPRLGEPSRRAVCRLDEHPVACGRSGSWNDEQLSKSDPLMACHEVWSAAAATGRAPSVRVGREGGARSSTSRNRLAPRSAGARSWGAPSGQPRGRPRQQGDVRWSSSRYLLPWPARSSPGGARVGVRTSQPSGSARSAGSFRSPRAAPARGSSGRGARDLPGQRGRSLREGPAVWNQGV